MQLLVGWWGLLVGVLGGSMLCVVDKWQVIGRRPEVSAFGLRWVLRRSWGDGRAGWHGADCAC